MRLSKSNNKFVYITYENKKSYSLTEITVYHVVKGDYQRIVYKVEQGYRDTIQAVTDIIQAYTGIKVPKKATFPAHVTVSKDRKSLHFSNGFNCSYAHYLFTKGDINITQLW